MTTKYNIGEVFKQQEQGLLKEAHALDATPVPEAVQKAPAPVKPVAKKPVKKSKPKEEATAKRGRKPLGEKEILSEKVTVNFTTAEVETLKALSKKHFDVPVPRLIRRLLQEQKVI
jgi:hypothetical protein